MTKPTTIKCSQCGRGFASILKLTQHVTKVHTKQKETT